MPQADRRTDDQLTDEQLTEIEDRAVKTQGALATIKWASIACRLIHEIRAYRAEVEELHQRVEDVAHEYTLAGDSWDRSRKRLTAELAAERARHETTRRGMRAVVAALSNTDGYFLPDESFAGLVGVIFQAITESGLDPNDFIAAAASPSPSDDDTSSSSPVAQEGS